MTTSGQSALGGFFLCVFCLIHSEREKVEANEGTTVYSGYDVNNNEVFCFGFFAGVPLY